MSPAGGGRYSHQQVAAGGPPVAGYIVWYDPSDLATITESGGAVSELRDKSGNGHHLVQATGANQPISGTRTTPSGRNVLDYDGTNDRLTIATWGSISQPVYVFAVALNDDGANGSNQRFCGKASGGGAFHVGKASGNTWNMSGGTGLNHGTADTSAHQHTAFFNGASSARRVDGSGTTGNASTGQLVGLSLGCRDDSADFWDGWIGDFLVYSSDIGTTNRDAVEAWLKARAGTP